MNDYSDDIRVALYFVGFYKHEGIQWVSDGPFVDRELADAACANRRAHDNRFVVFSSTMALTNISFGN